MGSLGPVWTVGGGALEVNRGSTPKFRVAGQTRYGRFDVVPFLVVVVGKGVVAVDDDHACPFVAVEAVADELLPRLHRHVDGLPRTKASPVKRVCDGAETNARVETLIGRQRDELGHQRVGCCQ